MMIRVLIGPCNNEVLCTVARHVTCPPDVKQDRVGVKRNIWRYLLQKEVTLQNLIAFLNQTILLALSRQLQPQSQNRYVLFLSFCLNTSLHINRKLCILKNIYVF